ncbi:MAG: HEAT repeat domain-containing protein [Chloroflexota bacterium]|nr:HEAT repeat domain-containing protein [Chloroflexota bacterium]
MSDLTDRELERELGGRASCSRAAAGAIAYARPFALAGDPVHYSPDLVVDVRHIKLEIAIDPRKRHVGGTATHTVQAINDGVRSINFDAAEMEISRVSVNSTPARFDYSDPVLRVDLPRAMKAGAEAQIAITYSAYPRRGLYFTAPDKDYPKKPLQAWTQGQDEDSRHWYPCIDFPNHQQTSEVIVTVPAAMISIGNGALKSVRENKRADTKTYHWYQAVPHVTYLLSQIVGDFAEITHEWQDVAVEYYGPRGREKDLQLTLQRTPDMLAFLSEAAGLKYPYPKYAQTFVADFIFGGMENISATTLTETSLLDKRASLDADSDGLLAHELAHQWFGDLLTCRDWSHGWLNEGFATYFEAMYTERNKGLDELRYELYLNARIYMGEDTNRYRRPIVNNVYHEPIDLFDRHLYEKGSLVLHMIRTVLGDGLWRKAISHYVNTHRSTNVTTPDLQRAIEAATGRNIDWLFDEYVYRGGHPAFRIAYEWDEAAKQVKLSVTQTQDEKDSSVFRLPMTVDFSVDGKMHAFKVEISEKAHNFFFALPAKPQMVRFDPGHNFLKTAEFKRGKDMLLFQLKNDDDVIGRIDAAKELAKLGTREAADALKVAVQKDAFWAVQAESARALGGMRTETARDALLGSLKVKHPKARRGVVLALGQFRYDEKVAAALEEILRKGDASYYVEAAAAHSLGQIRSPRAFDVLSKVGMKKESLNDVIRANALTGMTELKDERALPIAIEWTRPGKSNPVRGIAALSLGKLGHLSDRAKSDAYDRLVELLQDDWLRVRLNAIAGLVELKEPKATVELERLRARDLDGRVIRSAREAMRRLREGADKGEEIKKLREDFDKLSEENRALKDRVEKIESTKGGKPKRAAAAPTPPAASRNGASKAGARASTNGARPARNGRKPAPRAPARARR